MRDNVSQAVNRTRNKEYIFAPISHHVKLVLLVVMLSFGLYGLIANSLILYFKHKQHKGRRHVIQRSFSRSVTEYFINSLALSDVLCSLISLPLFAAEMFIDFVHNDWICKINRFLNIIFPVITILNLLVIGVERYLAIFHPFSFLTRRKAKKLVIGAWLLGVLITLLPLPTYKRIHFDIDNSSYTLVCKYDNTIPLYRRLFVSFITIIYIIPSFILIFINFRILMYIFRRRRVVAQQNTITSRNASQANRFRATRMFIWLIFAFIIPYLLFIVYSGLVMALKLKVSFTSDYIARYISAMLTFANGAISASIFFHNEKDVRIMLRDALVDKFCPSSQAREPEQGEAANENNQQQTPC